MRPAGAPCGARRATRSYASPAKVTDIERRKVDRYLGVTKSAFLFGGRVLLVEGIAEALLLPVIAKKFVLKDDVEKLRLFRSVGFVPHERAQTPVAEGVPAMKDTARRAPRSELIEPARRSPALHNAGA